MLQLICNIITLGKSEKVKNQPHFPKVLCHSILYHAPKIELSLFHLHRPLWKLTSFFTISLHYIYCYSGRNTDGC